MKYGYHAEESRPFDITCERLPGGIRIIIDETGIVRSEPDSRVSSRHKRVSDEEPGGRLLVPLCRPRTIEARVRGHALCFSGNLCIGIAIRNIEKLRIPAATSGTIVVVLSPDPFGLHSPKVLQPKEQGN